MTKKKVTKKKAVKKVKRAANVVVLLDQSGSMLTGFKTTVSSLNEYFGALKMDKNSYKVWLTLFSATLDGKSCVDLRHDGVPVKSIPVFTKANYTPGGMTPLYDALEATIRAAERSVGEEPVNLVVITDGMENASKEVGLAEIRALMQLKSEDGWTSTYLGVHENAWGEGRSMRFDNVVGTRRVHTNSLIQSVRGQTVAYAARGGKRDLEKDRANYAINAELKVDVKK